MATIRVACAYVDKPCDSIAKWGVACEAHVNSTQLAVIKNKFVLLDVSEGIRFLYIENVG